MILSEAGTSARSTAIQSLVDRFMDSDQHVLEIVDEELDGQATADRHYMELLRSIQFVKLLEQNTNRSSWSFETSAFGRLTPSHILTNPRLLFQPRPNISIADYTSMELIGYLHVKGWKHALKMTRSPAPFTQNEGSLCIWYSTKSTKRAHRNYLLALASLNQP